MEGGAGQGQLHIQASGLKALIAFQPGGDQGFDVHTRLQKQTLGGGIDLSDPAIFHIEARTDQQIQPIPRFFFLLHDALPIHFQFAQYS